MGKLELVIEGFRKNPKLVKIEEKSLDVAFDEHFAYQEAQALAHAMGKLSQEDAMVIYRALGEVGSEKNGGWALGTDKATKVVVTLAMHELIQWKLSLGKKERANAN